MTSMPDTDRRRFGATVADAADAVATVLGANQMRGSAPFPIAEVLPPLIEQHRVLQDAVDAYPEPLAADSAGRQDPLIEDLAGFMSYLQLMRVLYHRLDEIPGSMRVTASRNLSAVHLAARRLRDRARRQAK